jgi:hypothetical protein
MCERQTALTRQRDGDSGSERETEGMGLGRLLEIMYGSGQAMCVCRSVEINRLLLRERGEAGGRKREDYLSCSGQFFACPPP